MNTVQSVEVVWVAARGLKLLLCVMQRFLEVGRELMNQYSSSSISGDDLKFLLQFDECPVEKRGRIYPCYLILFSYCQGGASVFEGLHFARNTSFCQHLKQHSILPSTWTFNTTFLRPISILSYIFSNFSCIAWIRISIVYPNQLSLLRRGWTGKL